MSFGHSMEEEKRVDKLYTDHKKLKNKLAKIKELIDEFDKSGISNDEVYWCKRFQKLIEE